MIPYYFFKDIYLQKKLKDKKSLEEYQNKKIKIFLERVCQKSPFYKDFQGKQLQDFPIINKKIMQDNLSSINTSGFKIQELENFFHQDQENKSSRKDYKDHTIGLSSGTMGKPSFFLVGPKERNIWAGIILSKALKGLSLFQKHKIAFCFRENNNLYKNVQNLFIDIFFIDISKEIHEIINDLEKYQPTILIAPAGVLDVLSNSMKKNTIRPQRIFSVAECLEPDKALKLKKYFDQDIFEIYQCSEGFLGITDPNSKKIMLNEAYIHIEKKWIDEKRFIPIVTDFSRLTQPFIRYELTDVLIESKENENQIFTLLDKIEGRFDDILHFKNRNDQNVKPIFADMIRKLFSEIRGIDDYKIEQNSFDQINIMIKPYDESLNQEILRKIENFMIKNEIFCPKIEFKFYIDENNFQSKKRRIKRNFKLN